MKISTRNRFHTALTMVAARRNGKPKRRAAFAVMGFMASMLMSGIACADGAVKIGSHFANLAIAAGQVVQIVAPASNTNGVVIQTLTITANANGGSVVYANPTTPTNGNPNDRQIFGVYGTNYSGFANISYPLFVPSGLGVYAGSNVGGGIDLTYDILN